MISDPFPAWCHDSSVQVSCQWTLMMENYIVNSLLCFLNSPRKDYPLHSLIKTILLFCSSDEIKKSKEVLCNTMRKEVPWRRDPEEKNSKNYMKKSQILRIMYLWHTHKTMPPIGFEIFAPLLTTLWKWRKLMSSSLKFLTWKRR